MRRSFIRASGLTLAAAMIWPALTSPPRDSFPLSDYPMFTADRPSVAEFSTVVRIAESGERERLDPKAIGGTDQPVQAAATVRQAIRGGQELELCWEIADRVQVSGKLEIVTERYDTIEWFRGEKAPVSSLVHAECLLEGSPS